MLLNYLLEDCRLFLIAILLLALCVWYDCLYSFFDKRGLSKEQQKVYYNFLTATFRIPKCYHEYQIDIYKSFKRFGFGGVYEGGSKLLYITDLELVKTIFVKNIDNFNGRMPNEPDYYSRNLLSLTGAEWKAVRSLMTPAFSSAKIRNMFPLIRTCCVQLIDKIKQYGETDIEAMQILSKYSLAIVSTTAFGIESDVLTNDDSHYEKVVKKLGSCSEIMKFLRVLFTYLPKLNYLRNMFKIGMLDADSTAELFGLAYKIKEEKSSGKRSRGNDFLQLLMDAADNEKINTDQSKPKYLDDYTLISQIVLFLAAGFETTFSLLSFAINTLATKPEIQDKLRAHIEEHCKGKEITYEQLSQMSYLQAFLLEILRRYSPIGRFERVCTKSFTIPGSSITIRERDLVAVPNHAIHMDPEFYPDPEEIRPERFMDKEKKNRPAEHFLAFGIGPKNCIGQKAAMVTSKFAIISLLSNFKIKPCAKTEFDIKLSRFNNFLFPENGVWVRFEQLK